MITAGFPKGTTVRFSPRGWPERRGVVEGYRLLWEGGPWRVLVLDEAGVRWELPPERASVIERGGP